MTTVLQVFHALSPFKKGDVQFLADLCTKYYLDIFNISELVKQDHDYELRFDINIYIFTAYLSILETTQFRFEEFLNIYPLSTPYKNLIQNIINYLKDKASDKIYTNCMDSGFDCEFLKHSGVLEIYSDKELASWLSENADEYDDNYFKNL